MTASGFRAAQAFVEITTDLDGRSIIAAARLAAEGVDRELTAGAQRAGAGMSDALGRAGDEGGERLVRATEGRMRDARGRFVKAGESMSDEVGRGADQGSRRGGVRAFLGFVVGAASTGTKAGLSLAKTLGQGFDGAAGPYLKGALAAAAIAAAPFAGALIGSGMVAGLSTGVIGAGIALAVKDPEIANAAAETGERIGDKLSDAAAPFKVVILDALQDGEAAISRWEPLLKRAFTTTAPLVDDIVGGLTDMGDNALPGMVDSLEAAGPVFEAIRRGLGEVGSEVGRMFSGLKDDGPELAGAMTIAFGVIKYLVLSVSATVNGLTEVFGFLMTQVFRVGGFMRDMGAAMTALPGPLGALGSKILGMGNAIGRGEDQWNKWKAAGTGAAAQVAPGMEQVSERGRFMNQTMAASIREAQGLSAAFKMLNGGALNAREAESAYQAAIDDVSKSIKENGRTLDLHTAKGRANDAAIRNLVKTTDQKAQATYDEVNATKGSAAAQAAASKVYESGRAQLIKNLTQILGNAGAAKALADKIMGIPKSWSTAVTADTGTATAKLTTFQRKIDGLHGKTVIVTVQQRTIGDHVSGAGGSGTLLKDRWGGIHTPVAMAAGGIMQAGIYPAGNAPLIRFAEPETGGEAYIPRRGDETRSLSILETAAGWYGRTLRDAVGESRVTPGVPAQTRSGGTQAVNHYHFAPGSISLDATKIASVADLVRLVERLKVTARTMGRGGAMVGSVA